MARIRGTVKWFSNAKGYDFLAHGYNPDVFVHYSSIESEGYKSLKEGDTVEFEIIMGASGRPQAEKVIRIAD